MASTETYPGRTSVVHTTNINDFLKRNTRTRGTYAFSHLITFIKLRQPSFLKIHVSLILLLQDVHFWPNDDLKFLFSYLKWCLNLSTYAIRNYLQLYADQFNLS